MVWTLLNVLLITLKYNFPEWKYERGISSLDPYDANPHNPLHTICIIGQFNLGNFYLNFHAANDAQIHKNIFGEGLTGGPKSGFGTPLPCLLNIFSSF